MKNTMLLVGTCALFLSACGNHKNNDSGYITSNIRLFDPKNITTDASSKLPSELVNFIKNNRLSKADAMASMEAMNGSFKSSYVGYNTKKQLIGKSGDEIFTDCKKNISTSGETLTTFEYYDIALKCLAQFKDTHLSLNTSTFGSLVLTAVTGVEVSGNKLLISSVRPNLIKKFEELAGVSTGAFESKIKPGFEITLINGKNPNDEIQKLSAFVSGSTPLAVRKQAVSDLFARTYFYPTENEITLSIKQPDSTIFEATLPWLQLINKNYSGSPESRLILADLKIPRSTDLSEDEQLLKPTTDTNLSSSLFSTLTDEKRYFNEAGTPILQMGTAQVLNKNYCYLKLVTFSVRNTQQGYTVFEFLNQQMAPAELVSVIKAKLVACDLANTPLIFDLRSNNGGSPDLAGEIFTLLEKTDSLPTYQASSHLFTLGNSSFINSMLNESDSKNPYLYIQLVIKSMKLASEKKQPLADWVITKNLNYETNIFTKKMLVLTSPDCISACEFFANYIKKSKRSLILGQPTSGTGFGFISTQAAQTTFRDTFNLFTIRLPNKAFQVAQVSNDGGFLIDEDTKGSVLELNQLSLIENTGVTPDILVPYTQNDLLNKYADYLKSVVKALN